MSNQANIVLETVLAGADLSAGQYLFVKINNAGRVVLCGDGEPGIGVLQNKPTSGQAAAIQVGGRTKVKAGGVIAIGAYIASGASGVAKTAVLGRTKTDDTAAAADPLLGSYVFGINLEAAASVENQIIEVLLTHSGAIATTAA